MTLLERADEFVVTGHPRDQAILLTECVRAHDLDGLAAVQRLYEDMYGGMTFNFELKVPAALCLVTWVNRGLMRCGSNAKDPDIEECLNRRIHRAIHIHGE